MSPIEAEYQTPGGLLIQVRQGDLTVETTAAIVNAANEWLLHGGGVAGAIRQRGGDSIQDESDRWTDVHGSVPTGQVVVTDAGELACRYVIHAVGPIWNGGDQGEEAALEETVWNSLLAAHSLDLDSVALPAISSGIFGFPKDRCAAILVAGALRFAESYPASPLRLIRFTNIDAPTTEAMLQALRDATPA